jgi:hypothetical protein
MDYTGTRREARGAFSYFFEEIGQAIVAQLHTSSRVDTLRSEVVKSWRLGGYQLATYLLPSRKKRFPEELNSFIQGMKQRQSEYELENLGADGAPIEVFDVGACEKLEARAEKLLKLATHDGTPIDEARAAALGLARMIAASDLALTGWERVRHFAQKFSQMEEVFALIRKENPTLFLYGARDE